MREKSILKIRNLSLKLSGEAILKDLSMDFWAGHVHAVIGPNGAGKSTLASAVMGLSGYRHATGEIVFDETSLAGMSVDERARMGVTMAWQEPARYEGLTVEKFVLSGARRGNKASGEAVSSRAQGSDAGAVGGNEKGRDVVDEVLQRVGLDPERYRQRAVDRTLSGGERKRVELASILAMEPKLVIMDEPDSGIDVEALDRIFAALRQLRDEGTTVLLITHSQAVLEQADHAFLMCDGRLVNKGDVAKIKKFYREECVECGHQNEPLEKVINEQSS
jgi:Fe-S cluster assembly ATP-binding protein